MVLRTALITLHNFVFYITKIEGVKDGVYNPSQHAMVNDHIIIVTFTDLPNNFG